MQPGILKHGPGGAAMARSERPLPVFGLRQRETGHPPAVRPAALNAGVAAAPSVPSLK